MKEQRKVREAPLSPLHETSEDVVTNIKDESRADCYEVGEQIMEESSKLTQSVFDAPDGHGESLAASQAQSPARKAADKGAEAALAFTPATPQYNRALN